MVTTAIMMMVMTMMNDNSKKACMLYVPLGATRLNDDNGGDVD